MLHPVRNFLGLCRERLIILHCKRRKIATNNREISTNIKDFKLLFQEYKDKIVFSSYLDQEKLKLGHHRYFIKSTLKAKKERKRLFNEQSLSPLPVYLKYTNTEETSLQENGSKINERNSEDKTIFQLPYSTVASVNIIENDKNTPETKFNLNTVKELENEFDSSNIKKWMTNYEYFDDTRLKEELDEEEDNDWIKLYGTSDPHSTISNVPCGGCGALLHCNDPAIPGYLPSEIFKGRSSIELRTIECQRCHFLKEHNIALDVTVQPEEYERLLQSIRHVKSLVLLMVDLLDFPCSIWPGIVDIIGIDRPIFIVANKVDLIPADSIGYLKRVKESLMAEINKTRLRDAKIRYVGLISAKTGYGVEGLITAMFRMWLYKGDVFLVGCTNVGKSSLFNALLQSDYCKVHAVDIVKRATVSRWPGTTLNLLKFPINRPSASKLKERNQRLKSQAHLLKYEEQIRNAQAQENSHSEPLSLMSHIGRTFADYEYLQENILEKKQPLSVLDDKHELFAKSKWFYDTPGVIHPEQVLPFLSTEELLLTVPKKLIMPQTYYLQNGQSFFIGGLARVDLVECSVPCRFSIFCSECLPITVVESEDADVVYDKFVGTELFAVPVGESERLNNWPGLSHKQDLLEFTGEGPHQCCGDIVLSSIAWVSVTAKPETVCKVRVWTPMARGIHKRYPSLLPFANALRGKRVRDTPAYRIGKAIVGE
ncbi:unnamed protein product [Leptidea sinapis]|uniref:G domain-containing protein n=1 Tax=Leptidea sinapis TaxID=189913 RepID=A0A5E4PPJ0_9NEOP|nr:unnamed protein product [Leptidea sinapis]